MTYRVEVLPAAYHDAWKIFRRLERKSVSGADRWYEAFLKAAEGLVDRPDRRALAPEATRIKQPVRQEFFKTPRGRHYRLIFLISEEVIHVLRVRAPGQRPLRRRDLPGD